MGKVTVERQLSLLSLYLSNHAIQSTVARLQVGLCHSGVWRWLSGHNVDERPCIQVASGFVGLPSVDGFGYGYIRDIA